VGNYLVVLSAESTPAEGERLFLSGIEVARRLKTQVPGSTIETDWVHAASFPRRNGSGTSLALHPPTGCWLLTSGTWFHNSGYGSGSEGDLLSRYVEVGAEQLSKEVDGFFVLAVGDPRTREVVVVTDVNGSCHCFARSCNGAIALSGSSLLLAGLQDFRIDPVGCQEFLCTGTIYEDRTLYREVRKLEPATVFRFARGAQTSAQRYWHAANLVPESLDGPAAVNAVADALIGAARNIGRVFLRPVCDLTGGYDSRALVTAFLAAGVPFATTVSGPPESADVVVAGELAHVTQAPHLYLPTQSPSGFNDVAEAIRVSDGEFDPLEYARILGVHRILSERFDVSINGSYGGIARGLWWELLLPRIGAYHPLDARKLATQRYVPSRFDASLFPPDVRLDFATHFTAVIERVNAGLSSFPNTFQMDHANLSMRIQRWQGRIATSTNQVWPCLSPFGFRSVLEAVLQTRARLRLRSLLIRQLLAQYQPRLADVRLDHRGYPALPATWRNLYRFWPLPIYFAKRVLSKGIRVMSGGRRTANRQASPVAAHLLLWQDEEVKELLHSPTMRLTRLLPQAPLADFLSRSRQPQFPFSEQWARLLGLELSLRLLADTPTKVNGNSALTESGRPCSAITTRPNTPERTQARGKSVM
jgi:hypothetical protein